MEGDWNKKLILNKKKQNQNVKKVPLKNIVQNLLLSNIFVTLHKNYMFPSTVGIYYKNALLKKMVNSALLKSGKINKLLFLFQNNLSRI